jgi:hypothetical protein
VLTYRWLLCYVLFPSSVLSKIANVEKDDHGNCTQEAWDAAMKKDAYNKSKLFKHASKAALTIGGAFEGKDDRGRPAAFENPIGDGD